MEQKSFVSGLEPHIEIDSEIPRWFWQSDLDPWIEKDSTKWAWSAYLDDICFCIEKAFILNHKTVETGNYEIDFKKMVQVSKQDRSKVRRIKREVKDQSQSRLLLELPKPQKTINDAFGNVQHFLDYIMKRTVGSYNLFHRLKDLKLDCKESEYRDIIEEVINSIRKAAETREKVIKTRGLSSKAQNFIFEAQCVIDEIMARVESLESFLGAILRVYTMETFICYWLNEMLRSENWEEINVLAPYLVCLAYTFKHQGYIMKYDKTKGSRTFFGLIPMSTLTLYRGTALTEEHLAYYDPKKHKHFSWNSVTSTSRSQRKANEFVRLSLERAKTQNEQKIGVLFIIAVDFTSPKDCEGMIDISQNSRFPDEEEIILAPGTVFELVKISLTSEETYDIKLKVLKKFSKNQQDVALLGDLQERVIFKDKAVLDNLKETDILKALQLLEGNQLVTKLEIRNCLIDHQLIDLITSMSKTTNIQTQHILFRNNEIKASNFNHLCYRIPEENLSDLFRYNLITFKTNDKKAYIKADGLMMKKLILREEAIEVLYRNDQLTNFIDAIDQTNITHMDLTISKMLDDYSLLVLLGFIKMIPSLEHLSLNIQNRYYLSASVLDDLKNQLQTSPKLIHLALSLKGCQTIQSLEICNLTTGLRRLKSLQHYSLDLSESDISDEEILLIMATIKDSNSLQHLLLNFSDTIISDKAMNSIRESLLTLKPLQTLSLNFSKCVYTSSKGLISLSDSFQVHTTLEYLTLDLSHTSIFDQGVGELSDSFKALIFLRFLSIDLEFCSISNEGLNSLGDGLSMLTSLEQLHLNLTEGTRIEVLNSFLQNLTSLQRLSLNYSNSFICDSVTSSLEDDLIGIKSLKSLSLNFAHSTISSECINSIQNLLGKHVSLEELSLDFSGCWPYTRINNINNLKPYTSLKQLSINLDNGPQILDEEMSKLKEVFERLRQLQGLSLNFSGSSEISDYGIGNLVVGLKLLVTLERLDLKFNDCISISTEGVKAFKEVLQTLIYLQHLCLNFSGCKKVSDDAISELRDALKVLKALEYLCLDFSNSNISDDGVKSLKESLKMLTYLRHLSLNFLDNSNVSYKSVASLNEEIKALKYLQQVSLNLRYPQNLRSKIKNNALNTAMIMDSQDMNDTNTLFDVFKILSYLGNQEAIEEI